MAPQGDHLPDLSGLPQEPVHRLMAPLQRFLHIEAASGVVLLVVTIAALTLANSDWADWFLGLWKTKFTVAFGDFEMRHSLKHWINDGLMALFFFVVGLEVKRELVLGELRDHAPRRASDRGRDRRHGRAGRAST